MKIKAVGFDFDGTLIVSEETKAKECANVFREKFNRKRGIATAYKKLTGRNRREKVVALFKQVMKRDAKRSELKLVDEHFGKHYERSLKTCPLTACSNIIEELSKQVDFMFLLSLENKKEVVKVAKHCGVAKYFKEILGGPTSKVDNLLHVLEKHKLKGPEVLYFGDAHSDVVASKKVKVKIALLGKNHKTKILKEDLKADYLFDSLCDVPKDIKKFS